MNPPPADRSVAIVKVSNSVCIVECAIVPQRNRRRFGCWFWPVGWVDEVEGGEWEKQERGAKFPASNKHLTIEGPPKRSIMVSRRQ